MNFTSKVLEMLNDENITFVYRVQLDTYFIVVVQYPSVPIGVHILVCIFPTTMKKIS
jgi:hypothetical protein